MSQEKAGGTVNGWAMLARGDPHLLAFGAVLLWLFLRSAIAAGATKIYAELLAAGCAGILVIVLIGVFFCCGHFTLQPNEGRVLILFGAYRARSGCPAGIGPTR